MPTQAIVTEQPVTIQVLSDMPAAEAQDLCDRLNRTRTVTGRSGRFTCDQVSPNRASERYIHVTAFNTEAAWLLKGYAWAVWESTHTSKDW